jgi:hypothetical protein
MFQSEARMASTIKRVSSTTFVIGSTPFVRGLLYLTPQWKHTNNARTPLKTTRVFSGVVVLLQCSHSGVTPTKTRTNPGQSPFKRP